MAVMGGSAPDAASVTHAPSRRRNTLTPSAPNVDCNCIASAGKGSSLLVITPAGKTVTGGIVNAAKVRLTGRKEEEKLYRYHSGYEGGVREERAKDVRAKQPARIVEEAVRGMLPKTKMGEAMWRKLKVYSEAQHPHQAQKPAKKPQKGPNAFCVQT